MRKIGICHGLPERRAAADGFAGIGDLDRQPEGDDRPGDKRSMASLGGEPLAETFEIISRKGRRLALAQIQSRLRPAWSRLLQCRLVDGRPRFAFAGYDIAQTEIPAPRHPEPLTIRARWNSRRHAR